jgi:RNA polymerase sigma-70 factor, ECF subfamily
VPRPTVPRPTVPRPTVGMTDWAAVYRTTYPDLVRYLHRKVWDEERACDLAQEAFARAIDGRRSPGDPANPRAWVFRIAANLALDEARLVIRRRRHLTLLRAEPVQVEEPDPVERLEREAREVAARAALERLSDRDREALLLWDAGMSYVEIAEQTGLAVGAVGTTLARARKRLVDAHAELEAKHAAH